MPPDKARPTVTIIGAGPAGLTAAYLLSKSAVPVVVLEADPLYVGGISKTVQYKGYHFDIGGHRFFSKAREVEDLWSELLPDDMLQRPRRSRIYYRGKFFSYPLRAFEALWKLGFWQSFLCMLSYFKARLFPVKAPANFEEWVSNQFGKRLFRIFFKTYTEKVWGMSCRHISADWAAQRIKGLSLGSAAWNALRPRKKTKARDQVIKTLLDSFRYPRKGPGMMWEACAGKVTSLGGDIRRGCAATACSFDAAAKTWRVDYRDSSGERHSVRSRHLISSAPLRELVHSLQPPPPREALDAASSLTYRDFLTVMVIMVEKHLFDDNWVYIHDPHVKVGRVQNFKSWSPEMVPDASRCCYGLEYFCFEGDETWSTPDEELLQLAMEELARIGLAEKNELLDGCVVRQKKAYPVYDKDYAQRVELLRGELEKSYCNLHLVGRNGMHKYNNQDHAMMTAMLTVQNILAGKRLYDVWQVNQDAEYHEAGSAGAQATVSDTPRQVQEQSTRAR